MNALKARKQEGKGVYLSIVNQLKQIKMTKLKSKYGNKIDSILRGLGMIHNLPLIVWAKKKGYIRVHSATQGEWTEAGVLYFFSK